jgi:hypothetical protein
MTDKANHNLESLPTANYSSAVARAVAWLGDRYLLAKPINAAPGRGTRRRLEIDRVRVTERSTSGFLPQSCNRP